VRGWGAIAFAIAGKYLLLRWPGVIHTECQRKQFSEIRLLRFGTTGGFGRLDLVTEKGFQQGGKYAQSVA
jgi:hypothetical protein